MLASAEKHVKINFALFSKMCNFMQQCLCHYRCCSMCEEVWEGMLTFRSGAKANAAVAPVGVLVLEKFIIIN